MGLRTLASAPMAGYGWNNPYYEHRDGVVVFIPGYWRAPGAVFVPPAAGMAVVMVAARPGAVAGPRPLGPNGVFVPPPPGSRHGVIVPAPIGTSPAVVMGAPQVVRPGMQVTPGDSGMLHIQAPPAAVASGRAYSSTAPSQAHVAAAQTPMVRAVAPAPASSAPIRTYSPRQGFSALPPARPVERSPAAAPQPTRKAAEARPAPPPPRPTAPGQAAPLKPEAPPKAAPKTGHGEREKEK